MRVVISLFRRLRRVSDETRVRAHARVYSLFGSAIRLLAAIRVCDSGRAQNATKNMRRMFLRDVFLINIAAYFFKSMKFFMILETTIVGAHATIWETFSRAYSKAFSARRRCAF